MPIVHDKITEYANQANATADSIKNRIQEMTDINLHDYCGVEN